MSQENVALAREWIEAMNRRDPRLWTAYAAPEIEWVPAGPAAVEQPLYRGYEEAERGLSAVWEEWEAFEFSESEARDLGDSVLWLGHVRMRGGASHVELDQEFALHGQLRDGRLIRVKAYLSWSEAFEEIAVEG
jgi:ketosteroid isomerase-like protein